MQDVAREQASQYEPGRADNLHRLNMGVFPQGAHHSQPLTTRSRGFSCDGPGGHGAFRPRLSGHGLAHGGVGAGALLCPVVQSPAANRSIPSCHGAMEATLTPLMERIEAAHPGIKVFQSAQRRSPGAWQACRVGREGAPRLVPAVAGMHQAIAPVWCSMGPETVRHL